MLTNTKPIDLIIVTIIICTVWWLQSAASDLKWLTYLEVITPLMCYSLDTLDQLTASIALWHIVASELYCTTVLYLSPQNSPKWAY